MTNAQWILAAIAPEAVAPHPNFSVKEPSAAECLGLISDGRSHELERLGDGAGSPEKAWVLVRACRDSLLLGSQGRAVDELLTLVQDRGLDLGARAAGALFLCVALSEQDRSPEALPVLARLIRSAARSRGRTPAASVCLVESALRQQRVLRFAESGRFVDAESEAREVEKLRPRAGEAFEEFPTSRGTKWNSAAAQRLALQTLRRHARASRSLLEDFPGRLWVDVVRTPNTPIEERTEHRRAEAGAAFVAAEFEQSMSWSRHRRRFFRGDPIDSPASTALLRAELSGDLSGLRRHREFLGMLRAQRRSDESAWALGEAVRLLRHADAREPLEDVLRWVRAAGPTTVLSDAAAAVLRRRANGLPATRSDLAVLAGSAEVLTNDQLVLSLDVVRAYADYPTTLLRPVTEGWADFEASWRAIAALLPGSRCDDRVARDALAFVERTMPDLITASALRSVVGAIDWSGVGRDIKDEWRQWAERQSAAELFEFTSAVLDGIVGIRRHEVGPPRPTGLSLAPRLLWENAHDVQVPQDDVVSVATACAADLQRIRLSAAKGAYSFGGVSTTDVATLLIGVFGRSELLRPLFACLIDPLVSVDDKAPALDRLALLRPELPDSIRRRVGTQRAFDKLAVSNVDPFRSGRKATTAPALRFAVAYGLLSAQRQMTLTIELVGSAEPEDRVEACRSLDVMCSVSAPPEWAAALLLQLTRDVDPLVRAEGARAAASFWNLLPVQRAAEERIEELLEDHGILVPLLTLRGLARSGSTPKRVRGWLATEGSRHSARVVRALVAELQSAQGTGPRSQGSQ